MHLLVEVGAEHDVADIVEQHDSYQFAVSAYYREEVALGGGYGVYHLFERHVGRDDAEVAFYHVVEPQESEHVLVLVVRQQVAVLGQTHGVDAVRLENPDGHIRERGDYEQRQEEVVTACHLGCKENSHQRGVHDPGHDSGHPHECEVLLRKVDGEAEVVHHIGEKESRQRPDEQRRRKGTAHAAGAVGGRSGEDFRKHDGRYHHGYYPHVVAVYVEERTVYHRADIPLQETVYGLVPLAVERREQENERCQEGAAEQYLDPPLLYVAEEAFHAETPPREVKRHESGENA